MIRAVSKKLPVLSFCFSLLAEKVPSESPVTLVTHEKEMVMLPSRLHFAHCHLSACRTGLQSVARVNGYIIDCEGSSTQLGLLGAR